jgi:hypothetical protein
MRTPEKIIREMRGWEYESYKVIAKWADALEQAMLEPVAEVYESADSVCGERGTEIDWIGSRRCDPGTKLYALPPDAAGEIENLRFIVKMLLHYIDTGDMRELDLRIARTAIAATEDK